MESEPRAEARKEQAVTEEIPAPAAEEGLIGDVTDPVQPQAAPQSDAAVEIAELKQAVHERTNDLKRLQAEYVNYKRRVDRDRDVARNAGVESVITDLMGLLDTIRIAREHEEMTGGFKLLVDELEKITGKHGLEIFGDKGEVFDPQVHEALMQAPMPGVTEPTVLEVMQVGYRFKGRVLRAARVAVGMPTDEAPDTAASSAGTEATGATSPAGTDEAATARAGADEAGGEPPAE